MKDILFTEPIAQQRIWGGRGLAEKFGIPYRCDRPGEIIAAAGFSGHDTPLRGHSGTLSSFYAANGDYFGLSQPQFPLAVNLIDAREALSVQVHPPEEYAGQNEGCCGMPEAWVVLEAQAGARLVAGHTAATTEAFAREARDGRWDRLLTWHPAVKGDCYLLPPGTVHAVGAGIRVYEVTHAADVVYRLYDYRRRDAGSGQPRELHLRQALDVVYAPQRVTKSPGTLLETAPGLSVEELADLPGVYTLRRLAVSLETSYSQEPFGIYTVTEGAGAVNGLQVRQGDTFLVPCGGEMLCFQGRFTCYMATFREK